MAPTRRRRAVVNPGQFQVGPDPKRPRLDGDKPEEDKEKTPPPEAAAEGSVTPTPPKNHGEEVEQAVASATEDLTPPPPRHHAESFSKEVLREVEALDISSDDVSAKDRLTAEDPEERERRAEIPSASAVQSFRSFQSGEMGFESTPLVHVPESARNALLSNRPSAVAYFGDLSKMPEREKAKVWTLRASAAVAEDFARVPEPIAETQRLLMQVVQQQFLASEINEDLRSRLEIAEVEANLDRLKRKAAEEASAEAQAEVERLQQNAQIVLADLEERIFPLMRQGAEMLRKYEVEDIPGLESRIQQIKEEGEEQLRAAEAESLRAQGDLQSEIQRLRDELKQTEDRLKVKEEEAAKTETELEAANKLLEVRIYTQEEYNEGYENGYRIARRLAFHAEPNINWDLAEDWSMDINDPHMTEPHPAETEFLARQAEAEAREEEAERLAGSQPGPPDAEA